MATISIGPGGLAVTGDTTSCSNQNYLADGGNALGGLINKLGVQQLTGLTTLKYSTLNLEVDRHMPMRASTADRVDQVNFYRTDVGYDNLLNSSGGFDATPETGTYTDTQKFLDSCGVGVNRGIDSSVNMNAEACNPSINGPRPSIGREGFGRVLRGSRLPFPAMCFAQYTNKEAFYDHLQAIFQVVKNGVITRFAADQHRFIIGNSLYNVAALQSPQSNGQAKLIEEGVATANEFGFAPTHWGSASWMALQLRQSEIPPDVDLTVHLPVAIFKKYKEGLLNFGLNLYGESKNITRDINGFIFSMQNENLVYQDEIYGRKITFVATTEPIYVEFEETGTNGGTWQYQEPWVVRESDTQGQIIRRRNPNWGRACSCAGKTLAAIVTVTADSGPKPFYKEPAPNNNPDTRLRSLISQYARDRGATVNTTLEQIYGTSAEMVIWTGVEAEKYVLDPINRRAWAAGLNCDVVNNIENTWIGGYAKVGAVFVTNRPHEIVNFALKMPPVNECVELVTSCNDGPAAPEPGDFSPKLNTEPVILAPLPEPEPAPEPSAGVVSMIGRATNVQAPCTGTKSVEVRFVRTGGSVGAGTINVAATPTAHGGTVPATVNFADGQTEALLTWEIPAWTCATPPEAPETFQLTLTDGTLDLADDAFTTRTICIRCNPNCPGVCDVDTPGCASC